MFGPSRRVARRTSRRTSRRVNRRQSMWDSTEEPGYDEGAPAAQEPDITEELTKLASLRDKGILTEEEFQAKKKQMLGI